MIRRPPRSTLFPSPPLFRPIQQNGKAPDPRSQGSGDIVYLDDPATETASRGTSSRRSSHRSERLRPAARREDRKSTRLNSSHLVISYAVFCLKKKKNKYKKSMNILLLLYTIKSRYCGFLSIIISQYLEIVCRVVLRYN